MRNRGDTMIQLFLRNLLRALIIFLPVAILSFGKETSNDMVSATVPLIVFTIFLTVIGVIVWVRGRKYSNHDNRSNSTGNQ